MENRRGRPATPQPERNAWAFICQLIENAAVRQGYKKKALEAFFAVGDGTGRVWRAWRSGRRMPDAFVRSRVLREAQQRKLLTITPLQVQWLSQLPAGESYFLPGGAIDLDFTLPHPKWLDDLPAPVRFRRTIGELLDDAEAAQGLDTIASSRTYFLRTLDLEDRARDAPKSKLHQTLKSLKRQPGPLEKEWRTAVKGVRTLLQNHEAQLANQEPLSATESELAETGMFAGRAKEIVRAILLAAYLEAASQSNLRPSRAQNGHQ